MSLNTESEEVCIQCVYGDSHINHLDNCLIPALRRAYSGPIRLYTINFDPKGLAKVRVRKFDNLEVIDVENSSGQIAGFAENHNKLFNFSAPDNHFVIINPDCIPQIGSIDLLVARKRKSSIDRKVAIVEGRQWPFEHPKEYDKISLETPWASGAFSLIDSGFYKSIGGMDEIYFLYLEDVDLSWQAWLNGYAVIYEPAAVVTHFSGGPFYRNDIISAEQYFSLRNFLIISHKFFGDEGELLAISMIKKFSDFELSEVAISEYFEVYKPRISRSYWGRKHRNVKILGVNQFHELRCI